MRRTVLCLSGHDPSGGAGLHADILGVHAQGAHALSVPTVLTAQDTLNVEQVEALAVAPIEAAVRCLIRDIPIHALKVGLLGSVDQIEWVAALAAELGIPCVVDPILRAGGGRDLSSTAHRDALLSQLLPVTTVLTPNAAEARRLVPAAASLDECAATLIDTGCQHLLVTGGDESDAQVINRWYAADGERQVFEWARWPDRFRGAGCTLAAALAARLALGDPVATAISQAQAWTHASLGRRYAIGHGRSIPDRS